MTDPVKTPPFLSLRWKTLLTAALLVLVILCLLAWHLQHRYRQSLSETLVDLKLENIESLERVFHRSGEEWQQYLGQLVTKGQTVVQSIPDLEPDGLQSLAYNLDENWPNLVSLAGASHLFLLDSNHQVRSSWENETATPLNVEQLLNNLDANVGSSAKLICSNRCQQVIHKSVYQNNRVVAVVIMVRPFHYLASEFESESQSHIGLLQLENTTAKANGGTGQAPTTMNQDLLQVEPWSATLLSSNDVNLFSNILPAAAQQFSQIDLEINGEMLRVNDRQFALNILPVRGANNQNMRFVLVNEISKERDRIIKSLLQDSVVMLSLLAVLVFYFAFLSWKYLSRINQQLQVLPMLGQKQFHEVRTLIRQNRSSSFYRDEFNSLDDSVTTLTYELEAVEKAASHRTREMERLSLFDSLTGLANRNLFLYELQRDVQRFQQHGGMLAIVILDLDKFKRINDTLSHQLGDMLLNKIGSRLRTATRTLGLVSRLGGDEFALILRSARKIAQIEVLCQKILDLVHKPIILNNNTIITSCSLGISLAGADQSATDLVKNAEIAMYKAKEAGGNTFRVFNSVMATEAHHNLSLETEIRRAFENREFTLYLQPKVNMDSDIVGFESLVRWDHPDRGILPPAEFIPAMESMGFISQLDNFILDSSCRQLKVLSQHFPGINIAVNISSTHFTEKSFLVYLKDCLKKYPIEPHCLELEITETLLMENMNLGMEILKQIKELGVSIAIDDFGTGYSSLSYLKNLPVDTIKIDREFIKDIPDSESDMQISSVIIFLAKQLNFKVVAEGVETSEQMVFLKANHCDLAQGFYFSKPIPAHKAMLLLESQRRDKQSNIKQFL